MESVEVEAGWPSTSIGVSDTPETMADTLTAIETTRSRFLDEHVPAVRRIIAGAAALGRTDLLLRAQIVLADIDSKHGDAARSAVALAELIDRAAAAGEPYAEARGHYLLAVVRHGMGDLPDAYRHAVDSVELLPAGAPVDVRIDHLVMLALCAGPGPESDRHYRHALELTAAIDDPGKALGIHNNMAFTSFLAGDQTTARAYVEKMKATSIERRVPLKPSQRDTIAQVYMADGLVREAIDVLTPVVDSEMGLADMRQVDLLRTDQYALPECLLTLAEAQGKLGDFSAAAHSIDRADALASEWHLEHTATDVLKARASLAALQGDWQKAYRLHIAFHEQATRRYAEAQEARAQAAEARYDDAERQRDTARYRELAVRDALTGLYNRRFIDEQLAALTAQSVARRTPLSAAIVDADFFKRVNDECSHDVGDRVLQTLAALLKATVVAPETVGRFGGEEFVILLPTCDARDAYLRCEEVRSVIADYDWSPLVGSLHVTVSIGVATAANGQTSPSALLADADRNLYAAKRGGRNRVVSDAR